MNTNLNMKRMPIDRLKPAKYNPRKDLKPGDPAYEKIKRSLHDFGYVDPIVWNEVTGNIVGGHQRYKVLVNEGATEVDCVVVHIENPQDEKALNIALNKATGDWEPTALADLLQDLQLSGYDLGATGFDAAEVDDLFSKVHDKDVHDDDCDIDPEEVRDEDPANPEDPDDVSAADAEDRLRATLAAARPKIAGIRAKDRQTFNRQVNAYLKKLKAQAALDVNPYAAIRAKATHAPDDRDLGRRIMESRNANLRKQPSNS